MQTYARFLIGATASGSGKTTLTLGLLRCLRNRGLKVQPFKCGPDYIDTKFHDLASGERSYNLDTFLSSDEHVRELFHTHSLHKDVCVTEGVMGLFDGYERMKGSSAEIASLLHIPVILVINAKSMAYSAAALLYGFKNFHSSLEVVGVIFNFVSSESHYHYLKEACQETGIEPLGWLPLQKDLQIPSRHLGLNMDKDFLFDDFAEKAATFVENHIDVDRLLTLTTTTSSYSYSFEDRPSGTFKIAVARDEAFNFIYHENITRLRALGEVIYFSPLKDLILPEADLVYLPGGYPELFLETLSRNRDMHKSIQEYIEKGGKVWAECGGMMYLSRSITDKEGKEYPMVGIFDQKATMEQMKLTLGYRKFRYKGLSLTGHEFHYSKIDQLLPGEVNQYNARGTRVNTLLLRYKNALASYTHLYWGDKENILDIFN